MTHPDNEYGKLIKFMLGYLMMGNIHVVEKRKTLNYNPDLI